jgi:CBS domain-containing protein
METQPQGMAPAGTGMQQGMTSQQAHPQPGMQSGTRHSQQMGGTSHLQSVSLDDIIQEDVVTADPDTPLPTITSQMKKEDVGAVVITEDNKPRGIVTDRKVALSLEEMPDLPERTGEDVMTDKIVTAEDQLSVYEALQRLSDENVRRLPITDENDTLVGIVTLDDIMVLLGKELKDSTEIIKQQSPRL